MPSKPVPSKAMVAGSGIGSFTLASTVLLGFVICQEGTVTNAVFSISVSSGYTRSMTVTANESVRLAKAFNVVVYSNRSPVFVPNQPES